MKRAAIAFAIMLVSLSAGTYAQDKPDCIYVVKEVSFEHPSGLTGQQLAKLRSVVIGRCYDPVKTTYISRYVYDQLREWGFKEATVYDPNTFKILDGNLHPSPIAIAVDFRLTGSEPHLK